MRKTVLSLLALSMATMSAWAQNNWSTHATLDDLKAYDYPYGTDLSGSKTTTKNARYISAITATVGTTATSISPGAHTSSTAYYVDERNTVVTAHPGEQVRLAVTVSGDWTQTFFYVDWRAKGILAEDVIAFNGRNISGEYGSTSDKWVNSNGDVLSGGNQHGSNFTFTVPKDAPAGYYLARLRFCWNQLDPQKATTDPSASTDNWSSCVDFAIKVERDDDAPTYPAMARHYTNSLGQQNRYFKKVTTTGTNTATVFEATSEAELPKTYYGTKAINVMGGALIDKTDNPILVDNGTTSFTLSYTHWNTNMTIGGYASAQPTEIYWTTEAAWVDWNRDGDFSDSGEYQNQAWTSMGDTSSGCPLYSGAVNRTITIPTGTPAGDYRMRVVLYEPSSNTVDNSTNWPTNIFGSLNGCIRNGVAYDFTIRVGAGSTHDLTVQSNNADMGTVSINGESGTTAAVAQGDEVTVTATPATGYKFISWNNGDQVLSDQMSYTTTVSQDITLTAIFKLDRIGQTYPVMRRYFSGEASQMNRYLKSMTATGVDGAEAQTVFSCSSEAELPRVDCTMLSKGDNDPTAATFGTCPSLGALIDKTDTPIQARVGSQLGLTYIAWNESMGAPINKISELGWTSEALWVDWNRDGDFTDSGEAIGRQNPTDLLVGNTSKITEIITTGVTHTFTIPTDVTPGIYRMRMVFFQGKGTETDNSAYSSTHWHEHLFTDEGRNIRNGISYDFDLQVLPAMYNITVPDASDYDNVSAISMTIAGVTATPGRTYTNAQGTEIGITVTPATGYQVDGITIHDQNVTNGGTFTLSQDITSNDIVISTSQLGPDYCVLTGTTQGTASENRGRTIERIHVYVDDAETSTATIQGLEFQANSTHDGYGYHDLYVDRTNLKASLCQGDTVSLSFTAKQSSSHNYISWMRGNVFVDKQNDGTFTNVYHESDGNLTFDANTKNRIRFVLPHDLSLGDHRMRFVLDCSTEARDCITEADLYDFKTQGGQIIDFTVTVTGRDHITMLAGSNNGGTIEIGEGLYTNTSAVKDHYLTSDNEQFDILTSSEEHHILSPLQDGDVIRAGKTYYVLVKTAATVKGDVTESAPALQLLAAETDQNEYHLKALTLDLGDGNDATNVMDQDNFTKLGVPSGSSQKYYTFSFVAPEQDSTNPKEITISGEFENRPTTSAVDTLVTDSVDTAAQYYNMTGLRVSADNLTTGFYLVRKGGKTTKVFVRK